MKSLDEIFTTNRLSGWTAYATSLCTLDFIVTRSLRPQMSSNRRRHLLSGFNLHSFASPMLPFPPPSPLPRCIQLPVHPTDPGPVAAAEAVNKALIITFYGVYSLVREGDNLKALTESWKAMVGIISRAALSQFEG